MLDGNLKLNEKDTPGSEAWSNRIRKRARNLVKTINTGYMELAEILYTVYDTPAYGDSKQAGVYRSWGYGTFSQWAEDELGLKRRTAERLRSIWYHLEQRLNLERKVKKRLVELGWSKVRELVRVLSDTNVEEWIELAESVSYPELCAAIAKALENQEKRAYEGSNEDVDAGDDDGEYPNPPEDIDSFKVMAFSLVPAQYDNVKAALERASQLSNSTKRGHNLDLMCTDFLMTNDFRKADDPLHALRYLVAKFERNLGKKLVVIDPESWQIEYGLESLRRTAESGDE